MNFQPPDLPDHGNCLTCGRCVDRSEVRGDGCIECDAEASINQTPWETWWVCFLAIAHADGKDPGQAEMWRQDNWARNQTPQEAFDAEYGDHHA